MLLYGPGRPYIANDINKKINKYIEILSNFVMRADFMLILKLNQT